MYEAFAGNGVLCNPEAIFRKLIADPEFAGLQHVWALTSRRENASVVREFRRDRRVRFVRMRSAGYFRALATSGYLLNNATFPPEFGKRDGQLYLNTWHGTPLKRMGYDIGDPATRVGNVIRNFLNADYLLAANEFMLDQMYEKAHLLTNIYRGQIIEEGYPRIDRQLMTTDQRTAALAQLEAAGIHPNGRKIILYAPTWKGTNFNRPEDDAEDLISRVAEITAGVDTERYIVLLKTHQVVHKFAAHRRDLKGLLVPNEIPTNVLLGVTDVLVTDYSSIFFDFLPTDRPIVFLTPDIDEYSGYRGLYLEPEEWPGPLVRSEAELVAELRRLDLEGVTPAVARRHAAARKRFSAHEDGAATDRVIDIVFRGKRDGYRVQPAASDDRTTILLYAGGMRPNGITTSLINLLDSIDHDRFDVSVIFRRTYARAVVENQRQLHPRVRQFARVGGMNGSKFTHLARRLSLNRGRLASHVTNPAQAQLWDDEWRRCFGESSFDHVIDFSGYAAFWATLLLHAPDAHRSIWMHNDLAADAQRVTDGRRRHLRDLRAVFSLYREYSDLVSVSPSLREINAAALAEYAPQDRFKSARNLMNAARVRAGMTGNLIEQATDEETGEVAPWAIELAAPDRHVPTFIAVGRLSDEKNHARLIRAFALVHEGNPSCRLVIVGNGPLQDSLQKLVDNLGLSDAVFLTGHQANPYSIMAASDCFVLSSNYEGQPMVILEAMVAGLPVVTVSFGSVEDALPPGFGLITDSTDEALAEGMRAFLRGEVPAPVFDAESSNRAALKEFEAAVQLGGPVVRTVVTG
jgi:CDP-glycerol glycerophosphotransferase (TagB/SpsB family)/glycosyltransferase involved in cell wall biosynthesis